MRHSRWELSRRAGLLALVSVSFGCTQGRLDQARPAVGVVYGSEVQEREEVVLDDVTRARFGLRVPLEKTEAPHRIDLRVTRPGPIGRRVTEYLEFSTERNALSFEHRFQTTNAVPGVWNVRVLLDGKLVLDRALRVRNPS